MPRNDAQQAAAQVSQQRKELSQRKPGPKGLAEGVRKDVKKDVERGKGHERPPRSSYDTLGSLIGAPRQMA